MISPRSKSMCKGGFTDTTLVLFVATLAALVGMVIGVFEYTIKPVSVGTMDEDMWDQYDDEWEDLLERYFTIGRKMDSRDWVDKYKEFVNTKSTGEFRFTEEELNAWVHNGAKLLKEKRYDMLGLRIHFQEPVFTLDDGVMQVILPAKFQRKGKWGRFYYVVQGKLVNSGKRIVFSADEVYLGSARLPLGNMIMRNKSVECFVGEFKKDLVVEPFLKAWKQVKEAWVEGDELVIVKK